MIEGSGSGDGSGSGSWRPKNMWIRIRIRNTAWKAAHEKLFILVIVPGCSGTVLLHVFLVGKAEN
jgi:hypothetical protein